MVERKKRIKNTLLQSSIAGLLFIVVFIGFMIKLPRVFREHDKELHFLFYFYACFLGNLFLAKNNTIKYVMIAIGLIVFGFGIEYLQGASNHFFKKKIHGDFDIQDIKHNVSGVLLYSSLFLLYKIPQLFKKYKLH